MHPRWHLLPLPHHPTLCPCQTLQGMAPTVFLLQFAFILSTSCQVDKMSLPVVSSPWFLHHDSKVCRACTYTYVVPIHIKRGSVPVPRHLLQWKLVFPFPQQLLLFTQSWPLQVSQLLAALLADGSSPSCPSTGLCNTLRPGYCLSHWVSPLVAAEMDATTQYSMFKWQ